MARPRALHPLAAITTAKRQREALHVTEHRPWPLPARPWFMGQSWLHLMFAHWPVQAEALSRVLPAQLKPELYEGRAWLGITPFRVEGLRLRNTLPPPYVSRFCEVNVRTYVEVGGKPGIYFLSLDAASRIAVRSARRSYRLPYFHARISMSQEEERFRVRLDRVSADGPGARLDCWYEPAGPVRQPQPGSLEHWLTERYCLYTLSGDGTIQRGEIHHPPWPLQPATATIEANTMGAGLGVELPGRPLVHFSDRQDVVLWPIEPA